LLPARADTTVAQYDKLTKLAGTSPRHDAPSLADDLQ
jgi:hypothetical protein